MSYKLVSDKLVGVKNIVYHYDVNIAAGFCSVFRMMLGAVQNDAGAVQNKKYLYIKRTSYMNGYYFICSLTY